MIVSSLDILLTRFKQDILELGFEVSEEGFNQMKEVALDHQRQVRQNKKPDTKTREIYKLYLEMINIEEDNDFLENRYPEY